MTQHDFEGALSALEVFADDTNSRSARGDLGFHLAAIRAALQAAIAQPVQNETGRDDAIITAAYIVVNRDNKEMYPVIFSSVKDAELYGYSLRCPYEVMMVKDERAAIQQPAQGWMPIETAPRDGTHIMCYLPYHGGFQMETWWHVDERGGVWFTEGGECCPTHWKPLAVAPDVGEVG